MKKILLCALLMAGTTPTLAQNYGYAVQNYNGYQQPAYQQPTYQQPVQRYQQPVYQQQTYQRQGQQTYRQTYQQPTQQNYQRQNQTERYNYAYATQSNTMRYEPKIAKRFYVAPRLGASYATFSDADFDGGLGLIGNVAAGMYWGKGRADIELGYHFEREMDDSSIDFSQMDFLFNGYYDFKNNSAWTPFIGASVGFVDTELSVDYGYYGKAKASETNFTMGISGGVNYALNDTISLEGMLRGKYVFCDGDLFNVEALAGARFSF